MFRQFGEVFRRAFESQNMLSRLQVGHRKHLTGDFENQFQQPQFRVLIITTSDRRLQALRALAAKYTEKLFWIATFTAINRDSLWSPIWFRPTGNLAQSLLLRNK